MWREGAAAVDPGAKEDVLPEIADHGQVGVEIHFRDVGEDRAEHLIGECPGVEGRGQGDDVFTRGEIGAFGHENAPETW